MSADQLDEFNELKIQAAELLAESDGPGQFMLEHLRQRRDLCFALRRLWLETQMQIIDTAVDDDSRQHTMSKIREQAAQLTKISISGVEDINQARDAQFTAKRWQMLAQQHQTTDPTQHSHATNPLVRSLDRIADVLETVNAKVHLCHQYLEQTTKDDMESEHAVRVFTSLKSDLDTIYGQYQEAINALAYDEGAKSDVANLLDTDVAASDVVLDSVSDDMVVYGYTPLGAEGLDAPELVFEADMQAESMSASDSSENGDRKR
ncbi:hypothetical protein GGI07_002926 [Coemansia sp. Benny D115]|nr:hypothetical protein GGI07_002926 [Coemansia sp. Benny D115]